MHLNWNVREQQNTYRKVGSKWIDDTWVLVAVGSTLTEYPRKSRLYCGATSKIFQVKLSDRSLMSVYATLQTTCQRQKQQKITLREV